MSIQDESFPYDDLELSRNSGQHSMVFPHHIPRSSKLAEDNRVKKTEVAMSGTNKEEEEDSIVCNQDNSTESSNTSYPPESETSRKTNASEPTETETNKKSEYVRNTTTHNKSVSYQDIHSEYTKRRYKHVESKVGQYIANIKALDEKRRNSGKFQRHRSMPETLGGGGGGDGPSAGESIIELHQRTPKKAGMLRHSANDLDHMHEQESHHSSDHETENFDSNLTATTTSSSREMMVVQDAGGIYLDKQTYEQLLSAKDSYEYVQNKLQEKNSDYWRLKQNLETMRVEYTLCKDKLKQLHQTNSRLAATSFGGNTSGAGVLGRSSLQCLLGLQQETLSEKSTQTENILTPSPVPVLGNANEMFATPLTPDSNNNSFDHAAVGVLAPAGLKLHKTVATIQPLSLNFSNLAEQDISRDVSINNTMGFLRHRSHSMAVRGKSTPLAAVAVTNTSKTSTTTISSSSSSSMPSGDSAIDIIEVMESPKNQRQSGREEFLYLDKPSQRYAAIREARTANRNYTEADVNYSSGISIDAADGYSTRGGSKKLRSHKTLRTRIKRLFGACTKCEDANISMDNMGNSQQQSFSQIPLLEKSLTNPSQSLR